MDLTADDLLFGDGVGIVYAIWLDEEAVEKFDVVSCFTEQDLQDKYDIDLFAFTRQDAITRMYDILDGKEDV